MARRPTPRERLKELAKVYLPQAQADYLAGVADLRDNVQIGLVVAALERGDVDGALAALAIDPAAFTPFIETQRAAYLAGGQSGAAYLTGLKPPGGTALLVRFDARNVRAERWVLEASSRAVTRIVDEQRTAIRSALFQGLSRGDNPRTTARLIAGTFNRATQQREGGLIGLASNQIEWVQSARAELAAGDFTAYLNRKRRDGRFDGLIKAAIKDQKPLSAAKIDQITGRYADRLLALRAETIARTESLASLAAGQVEAFKQAADGGLVPRNGVRQVWQSAGDGRVRDSHAALDGESVGLDERFPNGLLYPQDPSGPPEEVINCRCSMDIRVDWLGNL